MKNKLTILYENGQKGVEPSVSADGLLNAVEKGWITFVDAVDIIGEENALPCVRAAKLREISAACNAAIVAGMDVATSVGTEHFSLQETDQINLTTATAAIQSGATAYPYHADGSLCRLFSAQEIIAIGEAATNHKLYHTTLCNHILTWARRAETLDEIKSITYSADDLPEDLAANMANIFTAAAAEM